VAHSSFEDFLLRSLRLLASEKPHVHAAMCTMLDGKELELSIDGARVVLRFTPEIAVMDASRAPHIRLESDRAAVLAVLDGLCLEEAVETERITLRGAIDDLVLFHDALLTYLHGAVRCPSFPRLLDEYRRGECTAPPTLTARSPGYAA
jgi:hypothetical protein